MNDKIPLSQAKARLSEVVRTVRRTGEPVVITVDGEPAVRLEPLRRALRELTPAERAIERALWDAIARIPRPDDPFDAVELLREGRR